VATRTLVLLRHAKSAWPEGMADHERPLNARGERDAKAVGEWLEENVPDVGLVLCSTAARTRRTWAIVSAQLSGVPVVRFESDVYLGTTRTLLDLVRGTEDDVSKLLVIGHNPGMQSLALSLAGDGDERGLERAAEKFPTSGLAMLGVPGRWKDVGEGSARLLAFAVPRG
jgi:phosphohistidine phosphatase